MIQETPADSKPKGKWTKNLLIILSITIVAIVISGLISSYGSYGEISSQQESKTQTVSRMSCSDSVIGTTEVAPPGSIEHLSGSTVNVEGLAITLVSINYYENTVAARFKVTNKTVVNADSGLYTNTGAIGDDGNYYYACLAGTLSCPYLLYSLVLMPGQTQTTCVAYHLPLNVSVTEIEYVPVAASINNYNSAPILWSILPYQRSTNDIESF